MLKGEQILRLLRSTRKKRLRNHRDRISFYYKFRQFDTWQAIIDLIVIDKTKTSESQTRYHQSRDYGMGLASNWDSSLFIIGFGADLTPIDSENWDSHRQNCNGRRLDGNRHKG